MSDSDPTRQPPDPTGPTLIRGEPRSDPTGPTLIRGEQEAAREHRAHLPRRLGPYELIDVLGQGGMGVVYRARHATLGTECAVKVLVAGEHASLEAIVRFQREAAGVARMGKHPNIVGVFDLGQEGPVAYYAMELVRGRSLRDALESGTIEPGEAARIVEKVARALHFAHGHGIVHRDVKPENVVLREDGEPQVMDFGLARDLRTEARLSVAGEVFGTPSYMAPEQARGLHDQCDARTDVYALGGLLYDALTGIPPHPGKDVAQVFRHVLEGEVVRPRSLRPDLPIDLETVCLKCLEADRTARYASAEALADDLARFLRGEPVSARPLGWAGRQARRVRRRPLLSALVGGLVVAVLGLSWRLAGPARIRIATDPAGARVEAVGRTMWGGGWVWPAGQFTLRISAEGCEPKEVPIDLSAGSFHDLGSVKLLPRPATLTLTSWPMEVEVTLTRDGRDTLRLWTPFDRLPIDAGTHIVSATREGHFPLETRVEAGPGASVVCNLTLRRQTIWVRDIADFIDGAPAVADLDQDGALDVVACGRTSSTVHALSGRDGSVLWRSRLDDALLQAPTLEDIDRDGVPDVRVVCMAGHHHALDGHDGSPIPGDPTGAAIETPPSVDLDGDGFLDEVRAEAGKVIVSSIHGDGVAWASRVAEMPNWEVAQGRMTIADLDADGVLDVSLTHRSEAKIALSGKDGHPIEAREPERPPDIEATDLDGDGVPDKVAFAGEDLRATSGRTGELFWDAFFVVSEGEPVAGDLDGDGRAECVVPCGDGDVLALDGRTGILLWTWRVGGPLRCSLALGRITGRRGLDVVVGARDGRVFVLTPPEERVEGDIARFEQMLAHRAGAEGRTVATPILRGEVWTVLERLADKVTGTDDDPWRRSVAWTLLGIARQRVGHPEEALAALAEARALGLRCPEAAGAEWIASREWNGCPPARREEAGRLFEEALRRDPDRLFDAVVEGREAIDAAAARDMTNRLRGALDDPACGVAASLLSTLLLPDDSRPPAPPDDERLLRAAVGAVQARLAEAPSQAPRLFGYLCLLYDALHDEDRYRATFAIFEGLDCKPPALAGLLFHVNARYGLKPH